MTKWIEIYKGIRLFCIVFGENYCIHFFPKEKMELPPAPPPMALVRRSSEETVLFGSLGLTAATCVLFPFVADPVMLAVISFVFGLGLGCCGPLSMVLTYNRAPEGRAGEAIGWRQSFNKFIEVVMPLLFGTLGTAFGLSPAFWLNAVFLGSGAALMQADARKLAKRKASA